MAPRPITRRDALRAGSLGTVGLAGCIESMLHWRSIEPPPFGPPETGWPMVGYDGANTSSNPNAPGPVDAPTVEWEGRPSANDSPQFALADEFFVVVGDEEAITFDLAAGERGWSVDVDGPAPVALDDQRCYLRTASTRLEAYDRADGDRIWTLDADATLTAPIVSNGRVLVGDHSGRVHAVDAASGDLDWDAVVGDGVDGRVATDGDLVAVGAKEAVVVLSGTDGDEEWDAPLPCCRPESPILLDGTVYTLRHELRAWNAIDGDRHWSYEPGLGSVGSDAPTLDDELLYLGRTALDAVDTTDGERRWLANGDLQSLAARPVRGSGTVYLSLGSRFRQVAAVEPDDGSVRWIESVDARVTSLAVVGDRLLAATADGRILALQASA